MASQDTNKQDEDKVEERVHLPSSNDAYELGKEFFGRYSSGNPDRQRRKRESIRRKIREKNLR